MLFLTVVILTISYVAGCESLNRIRIFKDIGDIDEDVLAEHRKIVKNRNSHKGVGDPTLPLLHNQTVFGTALKYTLECALGEKDVDLLEKFASQFNYFPERSYDADVLASYAAENDYYFLFVENDNLRRVGGHCIRWLEKNIRANNLQLLMDTGNLGFKAEESIHLYLLSIEMGNFTTWFESQDPGSLVILYDNTVLKPLELMVECAIKYRSIKTLAVILSIPCLFREVTHIQDSIEQISNLIDGFREMDFMAFAKYCFYSWGHIHSVMKHVIFYAKDFHLSSDTQFASDILIESYGNYKKYETQMHALKTFFLTPRRNNSPILGFLSGLTDKEDIFKAGIFIESYEIIDHFINLVDLRSIFETLENVFFRSDKLSFCMALRHQACRDQLTEETISTYMNELYSISHSDVVGPAALRMKMMNAMYLYAYFPETIKDQNLKYTNTPMYEIIYYVNSINHYDSLSSTESNLVSYIPIPEFKESKGSKRRFCELLLERYAEKAPGSRFALLEYYKEDISTIAMIVKMSIDAKEFYTLPAMLILIKREQPKALESLKNLVLEALPGCFEMEHRFIGIHIIEIMEFGPLPLYKHPALFTQLNLYQSYFNNNGLTWNLELPEIGLLLVRVAQDMLNVLSGGYQSQIIRYLPFIGSLGTIEIIQLLEDKIYE